jgi:hypothetical protein
MWCWRRMEKIKWSEKVTNEEVLERIGEKWPLRNNILCRKANWISHILRKNCHWRTDDESERSRKKTTVPWWFEKQKKILGAKGGSWRSKQMETTVYQSKIRKKYIKILKNYSCGLQLPREPYQSTRLLQLTGKWQHDRMWLALYSIKSNNIYFDKLV